MRRRVLVPLLMLTFLLVVPSLAQGALQWTKAVSSTSQGES